MLVGIDILARAPHGRHTVDALDLKVVRAAAGVFHDHFPLGLLCPLFSLLALVPSSLSLDPCFLSNLQHEGGQERVAGRRMTSPRSSSLVICLQEVENGEAGCRRVAKWELEQQCVVQLGQPTLLTDVPKKKQIIPSPSSTTPVCWTSFKFHRELQDEEVKRKIEC